MEIIGKLTSSEYSEALSEIKKVPLNLNVEGWFRDLGDRHDKRYGYSYSGNDYKEVITVDRSGGTPLVWVEDFPNWLSKIKDVYYKDSNSAVLVYGNKAINTTTEVGWHKDDGLYAPMVVTVNFGIANFYIRGNKNIPTMLEEGTVLKFDSSIQHRCEQVSEERYVIQFRKTKK